MCFLNVAHAPTRARCPWRQCSQTYSFARHFAHTCTRLLGYDTEPEVVITEDRHVTVGVFPIGRTVDLRRHSLMGTYC